MSATTDASIEVRNLQADLELERRKNDLLVGRLTQEIGINTHLAALLAMAQNANVREATAPPTGAEGTD